VLLIDLRLILPSSSSAVLVQLNGGGGQRRREVPDPGVGSAPADSAAAPRLSEQHTHDYIRHGTTSLFAALEVATGKVTADACYPPHTNVEFLAFLKLVAKAHPRVRLCVICDNYATHVCPESEVMRM
jgi:hypothetical protein